MEYFFNVNTGRVEQRPINQQFYPGTNVPVATPFSRMHMPSNLGITSVAPSPLSFNPTYDLSSSKNILNNLK